MILCVDDDATSLEATLDALRAAGYTTDGVESVTAGRNYIRDADALEALVTEYDLPDGVGLELVQEVREAAPDTVCVVFTDTDFDDMDTAPFGDLIAEYVPKEGADSRSSLVEHLEHGLAFRNQTAYPLPEDDDARVAALERYADNPEDLQQSFDRVTELVTELFDVDAAAIGLVDAHEERFLSCYGIALDPLDREDTVCTYAILDDDVTVIEDVRDDPRFKDSEGLRAANIRFYASAPLVTPDGHAIGTVCVYHSEPRSVSARERELLRLVADEVMEQLEVRRRLQTAGDSDE